MNCIDRDTDIYMVLKKSPFLPRYDETITERGYDNTEYVEKIRYSSGREGKKWVVDMKLGILCSNFFFRVSGVGMDSDQVMMNRNNPKLVEQYTSIRDHFVKEQKSDHPIIRCNEIEYVMSGWVSHKPYLWMKEEERDGVLYPKIAVNGNKNKLEL